MTILGIETSCDETSAAVVADGRNVLSNVVLSQDHIHGEYGGVVPELASRKHVEALSPIVESSLREAGVSPQDLDCIAVTRGPGLIGSLIVGIAAAKAMAYALNIPVCGVNHLHGHLSAVALERPDVTYPFVGLVVSGGHTSLYHCRGPFDMVLIGKTRDDAAGEAFDKVAKLLGLGYPGGRIIEEHARKARQTDSTFPRALMEQGNFDFSFSGLKTAVLRRVEQVFGVTADSTRPGSFHPLLETAHTEEIEQRVSEIAAAFQDAVVDVLVQKAVAAASAFGSDKLIVCGGVAANGELRRRMKSDGKKVGIEAVFPSMQLCTDNAAMIAARGYTLISHGRRDDLDFGAKSRW